MWLIYSTYVGSRSPKIVSYFLKVAMYSQTIARLVRRIAKCLLKLPNYVLRVPRQYSWPIVGFRKLVVHCFRAVEDFPDSLDDAIPYVFPCF